MWQRSAILLVSVSMLAVLWSTSSSAQPVQGAGEASFSEVDLQKRESLGLSNSPDNLEHVGSNTHYETSVTLGFPVSDQEHELLAARFAFQTDIHDELIPYLDGEDAVAGYYLDPETGGSLVILFLTEPTSEQLDTIQALMPQGPGYRIETARFSDELLQESVNILTANWEAELPDRPFTAISVGLREQEIILSVPEAEFEIARSFVEANQGADGPPIRVAIEELDSDAVCTGRENCWSPSKAGNVIRRGSSTGPRCTMGFHIKNGTARQFVTSGHCNWNLSQQEVLPTPNWHHQGYGAYGSRAATMYPGLGVDLMRVNMPSTQASDLLYSGSSQTIGSSRLPTLSEYVCATLGVSDTVVCGFVTTTYQTYTSSRCQCTVAGADAGYSTNGGDSGSPVFSAQLAGSKRIALGVNSTSSGRFARLQDGLNFWSGWSVVGS